MHEPALPRLIEKLPKNPNHLDDKLSYMITKEMTWTVTFYSGKVERETLALPPGILANFLRIVELIREFGPDLGRPHTAPIGQGIFEIRAKGREGIARSVFCTVRGQEIVILLTAVKKGNRLPKRQMDTARKRMKEVQADE